tara:strand:+ start:659 stop:802 length:144 start_codon:yes stop_codon:yes gene_type:complete
MTNVIKTLVTGCAGFIDLSLTLRLLNQGICVIGVDNLLGDIFKIRKY